MRVRRVYIKRSGGEIATEACYTAWRGFSHLGYPLDFFEWDDLVQGALRLDRLTLVVGGTTSAHRALRQIGIDPPRPLNVPAELQRYAGRTIRETTLGAVRAEFARGSPQPVFLKPLLEAKAFQGSLFSTESDLATLEHLEDEIALLAAEPTSFVSEWRYYVHRGDVVGLAHYRGDWSTSPDASVVRRAIAEFTSAPVACSLDFGVTPEGRTLLVEANDAFALGAHGIDAVTYARMLEDRWLEITDGGPKPTPRS